MDHVARGDEQRVERRVREHDAHEVVSLGLAVLRAAAGGHVELRKEDLRAGEQWGLEYLFVGTEGWTS